MNKVNRFPALAVPFPINYLSNLFISFKAILLTNPGKLVLAKEIATFFSPFCLIYLAKNQKTNLIVILYIFALYVVLYSSANC